MSRDEMIEYIATVSESTGSKLRSLMEKESELTERGNKYGEELTRRQFDLAVDPIIKMEYVRSRILELTRQVPISVEEISKTLGLGSKDVLQHISILRRRNLVVVHSTEGRVPKYSGLFEGDQGRR